jgi:hypothetical protein
MAFLVGEFVSSPAFCTPVTDASVDHLNSVTKLRSSGFFISAILFYLLNLAFPVQSDKDMAQYDDVDVYGTFTPKEAERLGIAPLDEDAAIVGIGDAHGENHSNAGPIEDVHGRRDGFKL